MAEERDDELNFSTDCPTRHRSMVWPCRLESRDTE
jgi:hypothetical protein